MAVGKRTIAVVGGGVVGPAMDRLNGFLLELTGKERPRICAIPTATGDTAANLVVYYQRYARRADATHLDLFDRSVVDIAGLLLAQDIIWVGGGNTANMLAVWRVHGVDTILREAWQRGIVLAGGSAGGLCWFECGVTDSFGPLAPLNDGLGLLPGSHCPHYDSEPERRPTYERLIKGGFPAGYAADDGAVLLFRDRQLAEVVTVREAAHGYRVECGDGRVEETVLPSRLLS
ncbi:Type 1 glutamine amidotransferase-like domain-containing protein [soil metagenome]